ncbi:MAG: sigma 54-interacting transcriptional regulator, partial [Desulfuromonadales bacterium]|nr:sigma 54-interacting transcriptional regulator [Desulfuromonadales bacterium]
MQNETLLNTQTELELARNKYVELYDFAPIGYFSFDKRGVIRESNLAGAQLLKVERGVLVNMPFSRFITEAKEREVFRHHLEEVLQTAGIHGCEIRISAKDGQLVYARMQSVAVDANAQNGGEILSSIVDITVARQLSDELQNAHDKLESAIQVRTKELLSSNLQLTEEIAERKKAEESLRSTYMEIERLKNRLQAENIYLHQEAALRYNFGEIIGKSDALSLIFSQIEQVAPMNATVLLLGETGTGKGVVARAIHRRSSRKDQPLITVNCATLPAALVESELFGRERGAFTGSDTRQIGRFELADGGTIFLDEIGDLPHELQSKLLRLIQDGEFERLGNPRTVKTDVRIIAATNRNLKEEILNGNFREDLYYRLNVFPITMPPLRERKEDIPLLVNHFVAKFNSKIGKKIEVVSSKTLDLLNDYNWPGNIRELESIIERGVITSTGNSLHVLDRFEVPRYEEKITGDLSGESSAKEVKSLAEMERDHILQALMKTSWRLEGKSGAALL